MKHVFTIPHNYSPQLRKTETTELPKKLNFFVNAISPRLWMPDKPLDYPFPKLTYLQK